MPPLPGLTPEGRRVIVMRGKLRQFVYTYFAYVLRWYIYILITLVEILRPFINTYDKVVGISIKNIKYIFVLFCIINCQIIIINGVSNEGDVKYVFINAFLFIPFYNTCGKLCITCLLQQNNKKFGKIVWIIDYYVSIDIKWA